MTRRLDDKDQLILDLLTRDSRLPLKSIGARVGLSSSSVQERVARLQAEGAIEGFTIRRGPAQMQVRAYMLVTTSGQQCAAVAPRLQGIAEITRCDSVAGETDMVLTIEARDAEAVQAVRDRVAGVEGVVNVVTMPVMVRRFGA